MIADGASASQCDASVFAFFSEVSAPIQKQFIQSMGLNENKVCEVATEYSRISGYALSLAT